ncbi:NAD-dependent epimerase [uncultured Psychroserpens sp.]|uniref:NAD-dependent epimerase n=1 Tax=uncultured Psychroserpens sp. TaxID=255436 RepID=UPI0026120A11|nr:NAD-dependent epimerase [uncultured Psychroserpens sp.]
MVVGNGLMAKAFNDFSDREDIIVFASGVSNSTETKSSEFEREFNLLKKIITSFPDAKLIYFSTCSIEDNAVNQRPYVQHKLRLEQFIAEHVKNYLIFRVSNVVGHQGNIHTIMNYLVQSVKNSNTIEVWQHAERNLIDADDVKLIVEDINRSQLHNSIVNVASRHSILVVDIIKEIEDYLGKKAQLSFIDKGNSLQIDTTQISTTLDKIEKVNGSGLEYIYNLLKKYYQ